MRLLIYLFCLFAAAGSAEAQRNDQLVTAGEHSNYSRIVFSQGTFDARVEQKGRSIKLYGIGAPESLNFQEINERRKAHRVISAKVRGEGNEPYVDISLTCDCKVLTKTLANGKLVLDIFDEGLANSAEKITPKKITRAASEKANEINAKTQLSLSEEDALSVDEAHSRMVALLQQASIDGLVSIREPKTSGAMDTESQNKNLGVHSNRLTPPSSHLLLPDIGQEKVATTTSKDYEVVDSATTQAVKLAAQPVQYFICYKDADFRIGNPEAEANSDLEDTPLVRISELQLKLADSELPDSAILATKLAAEYLAVGFGDEAVSVLTSHGAQNTLFADMGRVLADRPLSDTSQLYKAANCKGAHALWQAATKTPEEAARLLRQSNGAVHNLPPITKGIIATRLASKMIEAEDWEAAREYFGIASETPEADTPGLNYVAAKLLQHEGDLEGAQQALLEIASENNTASKDALLALAKEYEKNDTKGHKGFIEDIGAVAKTDGDLYSVLSEALAWAKIGNIKAAMLLLRNAARHSPEDAPAIKATARKILIDVFEGDNGLTYIAALEALLQNEQWLPLDEEEEEFILLVAQRSSDLGLPNLAYQFLTETDADELDLLYERANAAALAGYNKTAIEIAAPHADKSRFRTLVVESQIANQQHFEAMATAASINKEEVRASLIARAAWRARDWNSALKAFGSIDPSTMTEKMAIHYAFAAHRAGASTLPNVVDLVIGDKDEQLRKSVQQLFAPTPNGSVLKRSQEVTKQTDDEIRLFRETLSNG